MLASLLPGVRHLRGPLAAGYLWLLVVYLIAEPSWPAGEEAGPLVDAFHRLGDFTSAIGQAVALSFLAYVAGAVSEALFDPPLKWAAVRLRMNLPARRTEALRAFVREKLGAAYESMRWAVTTTPSADLTEATSLAKSFAKKFAPAFVDLVGEGGYKPFDYSRRSRLSKVRWWFATQTPPRFLRGKWPFSMPRATYGPYSDRELEQMLDATASLVVERDLESVEFRLLREHKDLYLEADRLRAEAEFRFAVAVPLLVLPVGVLMQERSGTSVLIAAGAVAAAVVLYLSGLFRNRSANDLVVDTIVEGAVVSPTIAAASEEAAAVVKALDERAEQLPPEIRRYPGAGPPVEDAHGNTDIPTRGDGDEGETAAPAIVRPNHSEGGESGRDV